MRSQLLKQPQQFFLLMRFHKPIGTLLLLWPTLWGLWLASKGMPPLFMLVIFVVGVILMRAAGCVINDIADRHFDPHVERTKERPLATRKIPVFSAWILFLCLYAIAFSLVCLLNTFTIKLAVAAALIAALYPFTKRFTHWPQLILGFAFSWGVLMTFAAVQGEIPLIAWILFAASVLWTIAYDTEYALTDREDDLKIGIKSTAILFGRHNALIIGLMQITIILLFTILGYRLNMHWPYYFSLIIAALFFIYHQRLLKKNNPHSSLKAFLNNNWIGLAIFLGIALGK